LARSRPQVEGEEQGRGARATGCEAAMVDGGGGGRSVEGSAAACSASSAESFAKALVLPYVPEIRRVNAGVEGVRVQQEKLVSRIELAKQELKWCASGEGGAALGGGTFGPLEATMDLLPHYTYKAQQCLRDMHQLRARVAKAKDKASKLARQKESRKN